MKSWTISRRIIFGFAAMLMIVIALGLFAIWRGQTLKSTIAVLGDNSLPSVLTLRGVGGATRDNIFSASGMRMRKRRRSARCWRTKLLRTARR